MDNTVERSKPRSPGRKVKGSRQFSKSFKLRVVKMGVEDGLPVGIICKECDIDHSSYYRWVRLCKGQALSARLQELIRKRSAIPKRLAMVHNERMRQVARSGGKGTTK